MKVCRPQHHQVKRTTGPLVQDLPYRHRFKWRVHHLLLLLLLLLLWGLWISVYAYLHVILQLRGDSQQPAPTWADRSIVRDSTWHVPFNNEDRQSENETKLFLPNNPFTLPSALADPSLRLLILLPSIPRVPETLCSTLASIVDTVLEPIHSDGGKKDTTNNHYQQQHQQHPYHHHLMIHRHGPINCPKATTTHYSHFLDTNPYITQRMFPPHARVSTQQQTLDYLFLLQDAQEFLLNNNSINATTTTTTPRFSHIFLLEDDSLLCPSILSTIQLSTTIAKSFLGLAHFGRGGSGILVPVHHLSSLIQSISRNTLHRGERDTNPNGNRVGSLISKPKNVDKQILEWALQEQQLCTLRPTTIQMRHVGWVSTLSNNRLDSTTMTSKSAAKTWNHKNNDQCGQPNNNRAWQALSETQFHPSFFSEFCLFHHHPQQQQHFHVHNRTRKHRQDPPEDKALANTNISFPTLCSPFTSLNHCLNCTPGYTGQDCGIPISQSQQFKFVPRKNKAPIVVLLDDTPNASSAINHSVDPNTIVADSERHSMVNLYVIGNQPETKWLSGNVLASTLDANFAFSQQLKHHPRFGKLAFPIELIKLNINDSQLLLPQDLWVLKYYDRVNM